MKQKEPAALASRTQGLLSMSSSQRLQFSKQGEPSHPGPPDTNSSQQQDPSRFLLSLKMYSGLKLDSSGELCNVKTRRRGGDGEEERPAE